MSKSNLKLVIGMIIFVIIIVILGVIFGNKEEEVSSEYEDIQLLDDANYFFSVESNVNKISEYVLDNNSNSLYGILNKNYIENNNISLDNVLEKFSKYSYTSFDVDDIYVISNNFLYKFFIKADVRNDSYEGNVSIIETRYMILNYDNKNVVFDLEFISSEDYSNFIDGNDIIFNEVEVNEYNKFIYKDISESTLATYYLKYFIDLIYENTIEAYDSISDDTKEKYFSTYDEFISFVNQYNDMFNNIIISSYSFYGSNCYCVDNYGNEYKFSVLGVNNYNIDIMFNI